MAVKYLGGNRIVGTNTERLALQLETPDYETDFSSSTGWTTTDTYSITGGVLEGEGSQDEDPAGHAIYDLQNSNALGSGNNVDNTKWMLRLKIKFTGLSHTTDGKYAFINLSDNSTGENNTNEDAIGWRLASYSSYRYFRSYYRVNSQSDQSGTNVSAYSTGVDYWLELIRDGSTITANTYTADDYSTGKQTQTQNISGTVDGLRYLTVLGNSLNYGADTGTMTFEIDDIKFYNGVTTTSKTLNIENNYVFEETDTGKHYIWSTTTSAWSEIV